MKVYRKPLSRYFPAYHPKAGQPTNFVQKVLAATTDNYKHYKSIYEMWVDLNCKKERVSEEKIMQLVSEIFPMPMDYKPKAHTIRGGNKVNTGDFVQFYFWKDKPYRSKQIVIAPPIEVKKVWSLDIMEVDRGNILVVNGVEKPIDLLLEIAKNDGLELADLLLWFKFPKKQVTDCQIICWDNEINY